MYPYQLVCSDIDGTLLDASRWISPLTRQVIKKLDQQTIPFVMISARMPKAVRPFHREIGINQPIVCYNGAYIESEIHPDGSIEILHDQTIPVDTFADIADEIAQSPVHFSAFYRDQWYSSTMDKWTEREIHNTRVEPELLSAEQIVKLFKKENHGAHKILVMGEAEAISELYRRLFRQFAQQVDIYRSKDTYLEINTRAVSKSKALDILADYFGIRPSRMVAFGDNYNDVEMLSKVGYGVAVENAREEAKQAAKEVTEKNISDGVANCIKRIFNI